VRSVSGRADFLTMILVLSMESHNESALNDCCTCKACKTIKQFYEKHPDARKTYTKRYYYKHRDAILLAQAFERYKNGHACQQKTLKRLFDAGFPVKIPFNAWQHDDHQMASLDTSDVIKVPSLYLGAFTGIQVS
jgi:Fe-S oxidoreductase